MFSWIIPGQRRMVAAMQAGKEPDPLDGKRGKQRSVHNTYFTLPVVFLMLSNHYSFMTMHKHAWLIMVMFMFAGALIRQFFVLMHAGKLRPWYAIVGTLIVLAVVWVAWPLSAARTVTAATSQNQAVSAAAVPAPTLDQVAAIIQQRCTECHSKHPSEAGFVAAPKNILLDDKASMLELQTKIKTVVGNHYMPLGNITKMTAAERAVILAWQPKSVTATADGQ
ncbi:MAG: urate hydroxylase PuuD [Xanthomonadales bacterium]|nr:urate hydroxylase PuuD [Xanthomonadales bacterium]